MLVFGTFNSVSAFGNERYEKIIEHSGIFNGQDFLTLSEYTDNMAKWAGYKVWQYGLWSFQAGGTKLERFLPKNQQTEKMKIIDFSNSDF